MTIQTRQPMRLCYLHCHDCHHWLWHHGCPAYPPPPWCGTRMTPEDERADLIEHIAALKEELQAAEQRIEELSGKRAAPPAGTTRGGREAGRRGRSGR